MRNFAGGNFLLSGWNLSRSAFDHLNFFQSLKQHFVNMEHWLKSKLVWPICTKKFEVKKNDTGAMTAAKNEEFLLGYNMKSVI